MNPVDKLRSGRLLLQVKPNSKKTVILGWDGDVLRIAVAAPAEDNRANLEVVKFFSRLAGQRVRIVCGFTSKKKVLSL